MTEKAWVRKDISGITITKLTPSTYNSYGYDKAGYNIDGMDRFGNYRGTGLRYTQTILLQRIVSWGAEASFTKEDIVYRLHRDSGLTAHKWHEWHTRSFESLVSRGVIVREGQHYLLSDTGHALLREIGARKEQARVASQPRPES